MLDDLDCKARIFLDFGLCLSKFKEFYSFPTDAPRYSIEEYTSIGLSPNIPEMYDRTKEKLCDAILVSHPHTDHIGATALIREDIPVFVGETAFRLYDGSMSSKAKQNLAVKEYQEKSKGRYRTFRTGQVLNFGEGLDVLPHHVDHSVPSSYAFVLKTSSGIVLYTGDFRRHGVVSDYTESLIRGLERLDEPVQAMICEGTHIDGGGVPITEAEVKDYTIRAIESACRGGLVIASTATNDIDRIRMFWEISNELGKEMVVAPPIAIALMSVEDDPKLGRVPKVGTRSQEVRVFLRELPYHPSNKRARVLDQRYGSEIFVDSAGLRSRAESCLFLDSWEVTPIRYLDPPPGSIYILSQTEPFEEEMELDERRLKNWLSVYGIPLYRIHTPGHARPEDIYEIVERLRPKKFFPIHTEQPQMFVPFLKKLETEVVIPIERGKYEIDG